MSFDLKRLLADAAQAMSPLHPDVAIAAVNDLFRFGSVTPVPDTDWAKWRQRWPTFDEKIALLGALVVHGGLRAPTVDAVTAMAAHAHAPSQLARFFERIDPLTTEMIRTNAFRLEEFIRAWIAEWNGAIAGETPAESVKRLQKLDYGATLREMARAEAHRKEEAERRARILREAEEAAAAAAAAQGWRE